MSENLAFTKMEGLGNDFVVIDARGISFRPDPRAARALCDRRLGIGCDQLLVMLPAGGKDRLARVEIFNADGTPAEQCGNGMRALARWLEEAGELSGDAAVETAGGRIMLGRDDHGYSATLPPPDFRPASWGLTADPGAWQPQLPAEAGPWHGLSVGNPHLVIEWPRPPDDADLAAVAAPLAGHPDLAAGANVGLAYVASESCIELRVHERGAGPTPACGSGACAAACALTRAGRVRPPVTVRQSGGGLVINWSGGERPVVLAGPANRVFDGVVAWPKTP